MKKKTLRQELIENYAKGTYNKRFELICCGVDEMVRFIKRYKRRKTNHS